MADITDRLAALASPSPKPLPPGTSDYGPLAYLVWVAGGILVLTVLYFAGRALLRLARVGFVAQDAPVYAGLSVADHLRMGTRLNPARSPFVPKEIS